jgi:hypothetical protein
MNQVACLLLLSLGFTVASCGDGNRYDYDKGYESAWDDEKAPSRFSSKEYHEGYQQGLEDAAAYDDGYYDGYNNKRPRFPKDIDYMDGYKDGKRRK